MTNGYLFYCNDKLFFIILGFYYPIMIHIWQHKFHCCNKNRPRNRTDTCRHGCKLKNARSCEFRERSTEWASALTGFSPRELRIRLKEALLSRRLWVSWRVIRISEKCVMLVSWNYLFILVYQISGHENMCNIDFKQRKDPFGYWNFWFIYLI